MHLLITGGSRGIGAATALAASARGWDVTLSFVRDRLAGEALAERIVGQGQRALAVQADAAEAGDVVALFDAAQALGRVDAVIHSAGIAAPAMPLAAMDAERLARVVAVNVTGTLLVAREAARRLPRGGSLVLLSSAAARLGGAGIFVDYAASKGAVDTLVRGLAEELGPQGIRVNAVRPGLIETGIHADYGMPDRARTLGARMPLGRAGTASEVAAALLWLCSDEASYVTGAILDVTGGR